MRYLSESPNKIENSSRYDARLTSALTKLGLTLAEVDGEYPGIDWGAYRLTVNPATLPKYVTVLLLRSVTRGDIPPPAVWYDFAERLTCAFSAPLVCHPSSPAHVRLYRRYGWHGTQDRMVWESRTAVR